MTVFGILGNARILVIVLVRSVGRLLLTGDSCAEAARAGNASRKVTATLRRRRDFDRGIRKAQGTVDQGSDGIAGPVLTTGWKHGETRGPPCNGCRKTGLRL